MCLSMCVFVLVSVCVSLCVFHCVYVIVSACVIVYVNVRECSFDVGSSCHSYAKVAMCGFVQPLIGNVSWV